MYEKECGARRGTKDAKETRAERDASAGGISPNRRRHRIRGQGSSGATRSSRRDLRRTTQQGLQSLYNKRWHCTSTAQTSPSAVIAGGRARGDVRRSMLG